MAQFGSRRPPRPAPALSGLPLLPGRGLGHAVCERLRTQPGVSDTSLGTRARIRGESERAGGPERTAAGRV